MTFDDWVDENVRVSISSYTAGWMREAFEGGVAVWAAQNYKFIEELALMADIYCGKFCCLGDRDHSNPANHTKRCIRVREMLEESP